MKKSEREKIRNMFDCKCAYCGKDLEKTFHADHVDAIFRGWENRPDRAGTDTIDNMFPSCPRCNRWKSTFTLEEFRKEIILQIGRLRKTSAGFRLAEDYGLIKPLRNPVVFWFENYRSTK